VIFHPDLVAKVLDGSKTVTRRPARGLCVCTYEVGRTYAVQPGRGKHALGRIRILATTGWERITDITDAEAVREGFADAQAFLARWREMYPRPGLDDLVWRIEFELA
jgi:hypothetical protein